MTDELVSHRSQLELFDLDEMAMPRPAPTTIQASSGYVRCSVEDGQLLLIAVDVVMWAKDEDYETARRSWENAKAAMRRDGAQLPYRLGQLKALAADGKMRDMDCVNQEQFYRLALDLPGQKAATFKDAAAYILTQLTQQARRVQQDITTYILSGKAATWAAQRVYAKQATKDLQHTLIETHTRFAPDFGRVFGAQNRALFELSRSRIVEELGLDPRAAANYRDHLGQYAQRAMQDACMAAEQRMLQLKRTLTDAEQVEIVSLAAELAARGMRQLAAFAGEDFLSGRPSNDAALLQRRLVEALPAGKRKGKG